jgi:ornithine decarboxylase
MSPINSVEGVIRSQINHHVEESFYVCDVEDIINKHKTWLLSMPRVKPFYAVKCNPSPIVLETLSALGTGFDCASKGEIEAVTAMGVHPRNIIFANPCKPKSYIRYAERAGVDLMTFDNEEELIKVHHFFPQARMVLRIKVDDSHSTCRFGLKFGADLDKVEHLLTVAKSLNLDVVGISYHVGSGCGDVNSFADAIRDAKLAFNMGEKIGYNFTLLDLGGGWPGSLTNVKIPFQDIAVVVNAALNLYFPQFDDNGVESSVSIIAEPGRYYVASAFTLSVCITSKRLEEADDGQKHISYYVNDGVYGALNCVIFDPRVIDPIPAIENGHNRKTISSTLWGPTCDSMDCIIKAIPIPEMEIGEWFVFKEMGAYTIAAATTFNGIPLAKIRYFAPAAIMEVLQHFRNWSKIAKIMKLKKDTLAHALNYTNSDAIQGMVHVH